MSYARNTFNKGVGNNILQHADHNADLGGKERNNNTFKSNIAFNAFQPTQNAISTSTNNLNRDRQFKGNPLQPPATRQSYQDSDIFANKSNPSTIQPNQFSPQKSGKMRQSNTFARSDVLGQDEQAVKRGDGNLHNAISTRKEGKWESSVFKGPTENVSMRKRLEQEGAGKSGLYGDTEGSSTWQKKEHFAAQLSKKEETRPPKFDETNAEMRKAREIYGENYKPQKEKLFPQEKVRTGIRQDDQTTTNYLNARKDRKAENLQSQVLTHQDEDVRYQRKGNYGKEGGRLQSASNVGWNSQAGYAKPVNSGKVDPYTRRQNELGSNGVLEQTDYSQYAPLQKKQQDMDNYDVHPSLKPQPAKKQAPKIDYNQKYQKQGQLTSSLDDHGYAANQAKWIPKDEYAEKQQVDIPQFKTPNAVRGSGKHQTFLASTFAGHNALKYYEKPTQSGNQIVDFDVTGLPENCDEIKLKKAANAKHVINTEISIDNFLGKCKGDGRLQIRLNEGETTEQVRANLIRAGFQVKTHTEDPRKKPNMTNPSGPKQEYGSHQMGVPGMSAKDKKQFELQTKTSVY